MLTIKTTGLEQYAPGGEARLKLLIIGGPGAGKTRFASFFPRPIYADCEGGLASVADRRVPYVGVNSSTDMLDLLTHLKLECRMPRERRTYDTVVIDTLDAYQRKLKNEWMERERKETFTGWEAWGFVGQKMALLLTRLLNLDMNVIVCLHYKDKTTKDDDTGKETHELMPQLQGEISDTVFNDFDLVGWMGTYWEAVAGERVQKRGLTFKPTPDKPFLKDRLHVAPTWMEVVFAASDHTNLLARVTERIEELAPSQDLGVIPSADPAADIPIVRPEAVSSGALPVQPAVELPLEQLDKASLAKKARDMSITTLPNGTPIRGNTIKSELITAIRHAQDNPTAAPAPAAPAPEQEEPAPPAVANPTRVQVPRPAQAPSVERVAESLVDTRTGEILSETPAPSVEAAIAEVAQQLGGQVVEQAPPPAPPAPPAPVAAAPAAAVAGPTCEECNVDLVHENPDYVKLAWIKYRKRYCQNCYAKRKANA